METFKKCSSSSYYPNWAGINLFKVNNGISRTMCEIHLKLIKTPEWCHWRRFCISIANFEQISHIFLVFPLLLSKSKCQFFLKTTVMKNFLSKIAGTIALICLQYFYILCNRCFRKMKATKSRWGEGSNFCWYG